MLFPLHSPKAYNAATSEWQNEHAPKPSILYFKALYTSNSPFKMSHPYVRRKSDSFRSLLLASSQKGDSIKKIFRGINKISIPIHLELCNNNQSC